MKIHNFQGFINESDVTEYLQHFVGKSNILISGVKPGSGMVYTVSKAVKAATDKFYICEDVKSPKQMENLISTAKDKDIIVVDDARFLLLSPKWFQEEDAEKVDKPNEIHVLLKGALDKKKPTWIIITKLTHKQIVEGIAERMFAVDGTPAASAPTSKEPGAGK